MGKNKSTELLRNQSIQSMNNLKSIQRLTTVKSLAGYGNMTDAAKLAFDTAWQAQQVEIDSVDHAANRDRGQAVNLLITALAEKATMLHSDVKHTDTVAMIAAFTDYLLGMAPETRVQLDKTLSEIKQAIDTYYQALAHREHGGIAQHHAFAKIEDILGMSYQRWQNQAKDFTAGVIESMKRGASHE